jgi:Tol biopolymer transport system component
MQGDATFSFDWRRTRLIHLVLIALVLFLMTCQGCGGGGNKPPVPPPSNLVYPQASIIAKVGIAIAADVPTVIGTVDSYTVSPVLPTGLSLNSSTGTISGTPTAVAAETIYLVRASNAGGSTTANLTIVVDKADIAFVSQSALDGSDAANINGAQNIWVVGDDGTGLMPVTKLTAHGFSNTGISSRHPAWSPDGTKIAYDSDRAEDGSNAPSTLGPSEIWVVDVDGSHATMLTHVSDGTGHYFITEPNWSPNGLRLAITSVCCLDLYSNVAVMNADGSNLTVLTSFSGQPLAGTSGGSWSPDGSKLLFDAPGVSPPTGSSSTPRNVWVINADGSNMFPLTALTATGTDSSSGAWSRDGSKIAFVSKRVLDGTNAANANGTSNIWVMNSDGSGAKPLTNLTAAGADTAAPAWSPDGSKIAFQSSRALDGTDVANVNMTVNLWVVNVDGTGARPLTNLTAAGASSYLPDWLPGGSKLVFESTRAIGSADSANAASNIWVVDAGGSGATPLTRNTAKGADNHQPKWRP